MAWWLSGGASRNNRSKKLNNNYGSIDSNGITVDNESVDDDDDDDDFVPLVDNSTTTTLDYRTNESFWSKLIFQWFVPVLDRGNANKKLEQDDLNIVPLPYDCTTEYIIEIFDKYWEHEKVKDNPSLVRALYKAFGKDYILAGLLKLVNDLCTFVGPQVLNAIILFLRDPNAPLWHGIALTITVTASQIMMSLCLRHYFFKCYTMGLRVRSAVVMAVYRKALVLSASERQTRTLGEITNLTSIDAQRLQDLTTYLHALWYSPLQIALALFFLWKQLGASSLGGVAVIVIMVPVTKLVAQWMGGMQKKLMDAKDARVELNSEVLGGMKVIKLQAWEESFQKRILDLREIELKNLFWYFVGSSFSGMLWTSTPLAVALATFAAYVCSGHVLDVASALTALALFDILQFPLSALPRVINNTVEAIISCNRVRSFLLCDEYKPVGSHGLEGVGIRMDSVSAAYDSKKPKPHGSLNAKMLADKDWELALLRAQLQDAEKEVRKLGGRRLSNIAEQHKQKDMTSSSLLCLRRIDFECKAGELVAVVGGVGCGKSSFVNAMLGEVRELDGGMTSVNGKLAYFSQTPFIMNATIKDNIIFGHVDEVPINEARYQRALDCCALRHDLSLLPDGDQTEIGEKGVTLSGGQKARIALARTVYHQADITLIDDALSAVDAHVAEHLFDKAIAGELMKPVDTNKRSVILVTNAIQYLKHPMVTRIVVIHDGCIAEQGSYAELSSTRNSIFSRILAAVADSCVSPEDASEEEEHSEGFDVPPDGPVKRRRSSVKLEEVPLLKSSKLMAEETRKEGHVGLNVYLSWIAAAGGSVVPIVVLVVFTVGELMSVATKWFLTYWSVHSDERSQIAFLAMYALINILTSLVGLAKMLLIYLFGLKASRRLFEEMLGVVLHAPQMFYDTNPIGRLINRFSKDIYTIDEVLMSTLRSYIGTLFTVISTVIVISGVTPIFTVCLIPMLLFYIWELSRFTITYRELKRLDSSSRSPIYALLGESIDGTAVIRSFAAEVTLVRRVTSLLDIQQHAYFLTCTAQSWLAVRLELIGTLIVTFSTLSAVGKREVSGANEKFAGLAGLAISYALSVTQSLNWSVRMASDMEANMVAVERVEEYTKIESEGDRRTPADRKLSADWPSGGLVQFKGVKLRYRPGLPLVLKGLDLHIPAGSKVGVVGRTGAGKSTLVLALLRIVEICEGQILIDSQDISKVGLAKLRSSIAVIPQDPILYSGSVRSNLDPFNQYSDNRLRETLERVGLFSTNPLDKSKDALHRVQDLADIVSEGGINFSVGQRQLLVIARALLHGSKIVLMDEATAAVDAETDAAIQKVMRQEFKEATVITVAHRLNTIMDSDYILVMSDGRATEFDSPKKLLKKGGLFRDLVQAAARD